MIVKSDPDTIKSYLEDASGLNGAYCDKVYVPENYDEISEILKESNSKKSQITISGGGTGTTGGRLAFGGSVLALEKLNKISNIKITEKNKPAAMIVQSGVLLSEIHAAAEKQGYIYPPDATEQNAFIGGNIATNASGARTFKYGATRKYVERLRVVLSSGEVLDIARGKYKASKSQIPNYKIPNIKNASGYYSKKDMDLIDLFIGSEGTLGVIVEVELKLLPKNGYVFAAFAFFDELSDALSFVHEIKQETFKTRAKNDEKGLDALAIEFFDQNALKLLNTKHPNIPIKPEAVVFVEEEIIAARENIYLDSWAAILEKHDASLDNVWIADNEKKFKEFKDIRHDIPDLVNEIVKKRGLPKAGTDIAVPDEKFGEMFDCYKKALSGSDIDNLIFGHIGDNHLHVNMLPKTEEEYLHVKEIYMDFVKKAVSLGGTVSAEHGIGKLKHQFLKQMYGDSGINEMIRIKKQFDPNCILGVGNIFPKEALVP